MNILMLECFYEFLERVLGEVHIFKHRLQISALEQARVLILGKYVLLEVLNTIYKHCLASAIFVIFVKCGRSIFLSWALYLRFGTCYGVNVMF